jgi:ribonuclease-3
MYECEEKLGYSFKDKTLLRLCFTHSSYAHEHGGVKNNERLEFFGDSILGFITSEYLMSKFPKADEGLLTEYKQQLVSSEPLSTAIDKSGLGEFLMMGEGERKSNPERHRSAMENLFEAIVAGIYLDGGIEECKKFVKKFLFNVIPVCARSQTAKCEGVAVDYKGRLQDFVQKNKLGTLLYKVKERKGPDHEPTFTMAVTLDDKELALGTGRRKSDAEKLAAQKALEILEKAKVKKKPTKTKGQKQKRRNAR